MAYNYVIIKESYPELEKESVLLNNNYTAKKKFAFIQKMVHADKSESIGFIDYSNDIIELQNRASKFVSWYNYPIGIYKSIQGYLHELN